MVSQETARAISESVSIPTIGIGAGRHCDGQVLVSHDMLGMYDRLSPKFVKKYADLSGAITRAVKSYVDEVASGKFPTEQNSFSMEPGEARDI